jgi:hypothetical protein
MLGVVFPFLSLADSGFWVGSPLVLNVTVLLATFVIMLFSLYFFYARWLRQKQKDEAKTGGIIPNLSMEFSPADDTDPHRPLAIFGADDERGNPCIVGNVDLLMQLRHITPEVLSRIDLASHRDVFERLRW